MTRRFTCRGFEGRVFSVTGTYWCAYVTVCGVNFEGGGATAKLAKEAVRRQLDAVERAFRERGRR